MRDYTPNANLWERSFAAPLLLICREPTCPGLFGQAGVFI
jgi:hypothetical protein